MAIRLRKSKPKRDRRTEKSHQPAAREGTGNNPQCDPLLRSFFVFDSALSIRSIAFFASAEHLAKSSDNFQIACARQSSLIQALSPSR